MRGGYGIFYDSGTLIENSALYFNPPYFYAAAVLPDAHAAADASPTRSRPAAASRRAVDQHDRSATSAPRYAQQASSDSKRIVHRARPWPRATSRRTATTWCGSATSTSRCPARADRLRAGRFRASATSCWSSPRRRPRYHALELSAPRRPPRPVVPRRLHARQVDGRHVRVPRHRRRRQHAAGQPQSRGRMGPVGLRRPPAARLPRTGTYRQRKRAGVARTGRRARVFTAQSGRPFTPRVSFDNSNTGNVGGGTFAYDRPNVVDGTPPADGALRAPTTARLSRSRRSTRSATPAATA